MSSMLCGGFAWSRAAVPAGRAELTWPVALCLQPGHLVHDDAALGEPQDAHRRPGSPLAAWQPEGTQQRPRLQAGLRVTRTPVLRTAQRLADVLSGSASRARAAEADSERVPSEQLLGSPVARRSGSLPPGNGHSRRTPPPAGRELHCHTHQLEARFGRQEARACVPGKTETRLDWKIDTGSESRTHCILGLVQSEVQGALHCDTTARPLCSYQRCLRLRVLQPQHLLCLGIHLVAAKEDRHALSQPQFYRLA